MGWFGYLPALSNVSTAASVGALTALVQKRPCEGSACLRVEQLALRKDVDVD